jgi:hypothetical protein
VKGWDGTNPVTIEGVKITRSKVEPPTQWCEWPRLRVDAADVAKIVRKKLKAAFPGVKFAVRTDKYAGGSSVDVDWQDGPTVAQVDALVQRFAGATFDGMIDLKEYVKDSLIDGIQVSWGCDYVMTHREFSDDVREELRANLQATIGGFDTQPTFEQDATIYRVLCKRDLRGEKA